MDTAALREADRRHLWHPFTQQLGWMDEDAPVIAAAAGCELVDTDGRRYLDGISSLWCTVHGHRHPHIDQAVRAQLDRVAHSTLLGLTHPPAIELAERLAAIAPAGLTRVFYSDSGSTAVEVALKMAFQAQMRASGGRRSRFVALRHAYHGDTIGSVSLGGMELFHDAFRPLLFGALHVEPGDAGELERVLAEHGAEVAAVVVEPLVQGAAGMLLQPPGYLRAVRELCDRHGALLVCDEVATGFGRTGRMWACDHEGVAPDLLCVAKGLTGGYLPLAATLTTEAIHDSFLGRHEELRTFFHGHTYTGNPLACAAALATLDVFEQEGTLERVPALAARLGALLGEHVAPLPAVAEVRRLGLMVGIELVPQPPAARMGHQVTLAARERGVIVRPLGDVVVLMPPLAISHDELERLVTVTARAIEVATATAAEPAPVYTS